METQTCFKLFVAVVVLLLAGPDSSFAQDKNCGSYFLVGGNLTLDAGPGAAERMTNILWKHNGNLLAEWIEGSPKEYYGDFGGRTNLDTKTGRLQVERMILADVGAYTLEINGIKQGLVYNIKKTTEVPKPSLQPKPLSCNKDNNEECSLSCYGEGAIPDQECVSYSWKEVKTGDKGQWTSGPKEYHISKARSAGVETFLCRMKNSVSEKDSEPYKNPFFNPHPGPPILLIIISVLVVILVSVFGGVAFWKKEWIKAKFCSYGSADLPEHPPDGPADTPEGIPLNGKEAV